MTSFLDKIWPMYSTSYKKTYKTRRLRKGFFVSHSLSARLLGVTKNTYLELPNQIHFWTEHDRSIVKVKNEVGSPGGCGKVRWQSLFSNLVGQTVRLSGCSGFSNLLVPNKNDLIYGLHILKAFITP